MKKYKVYVDMDWSPGGLDWDLQSKGMGKVYAEKGMTKWRSATLTIDPLPPKRSPAKTSKKTVDK